MSSLKAISSMILLKNLTKVCIEKLNGCFKICKFMNGPTLIFLLFALITLSRWSACSFTTCAH